MTHRFDYPPIFLCSAWWGMRSKTGAALVLALALGAVSWTVDGEIAYGGILRQFETTDARDKGLQGAVATAVEHREPHWSRTHVFPGQPDIRCFGHR